MGPKLHVLKAKIRFNTNRNKSGQFICYKTGQVYVLATCSGVVILKCR